MSTTAKEEKGDYKSAGAAVTERPAATAKSTAGIYGVRKDWTIFATPTFLKINAQPKSIDEIAKRALNIIAKEYEIDERKLAKKISSRGWTNEVNNVTKRLNRMNHGHATSHVLAVVYAKVLDDILFCGPEGGNGSSKRSSNDQKVKDTVGLAQEILFKLQEDDGALEQFAATIAEIILKEKNITLPAAKKEALINELRAQF